MEILQRLACLVAVGAILAGCSSKAPLGNALGEEESSALASLSIPLDLREFEVVNADGHRGVFLKLSRLPDAVEHSSQDDPPRIVLDIQGPTGGNAPEENFPGQDNVISHVRVERLPGILRVVLDFRGEDLPSYSVHPMADWIMIRLGSSHSNAAVGAVELAG